jgi:signal transduction histidine kinase
VNRDQQHFYDEYAVALGHHLSGGGESSLTRAYELGRRAVSGGFGVLDLAELHHQIMMDLVRGNPSADDLVQWLDLSGDFLGEALSAYELTHLGFREATDWLRHTIQFATIVCHELRAPLTSIVASTGMLQEILAPRPGSTEAKLLANINAGASRLKMRADSLTDIVGLESGSLRLNLSPVDLRGLITEIHQHFTPQLIQEGMALYPCIEDKLPYLLADRDRLEQVLSNLVDNAIKYGAGGKAIHVKAEVKNNAIQVEVQDFGRGIPVWDRPKLFQEHFRGAQDRQRIQGLGVGLALCHAIVTAHSGKIWVESEEGKGTTFKVQLPLHNPPAAREVSYESASY